jgi:hypothetical protein
LPDGRAFFLHVWDAQQIGDLEARQVFLIQQTIGIAILIRIKQKPQS